jgi:hypothetical protein
MHSAATWFGIWSEVPASKGSLAPRSASACGRITQAGLWASSGRKQALESPEPPRCSRPPEGSKLDLFKEEINRLKPDRLGDPSLIAAPRLVLMLSGSRCVRRRADPHQRPDRGDRAQGDAGARVGDSVRAPRRDSRPFTTLTAISTRSLHGSSPSASAEGGLSR